MGTTRPPEPAKLICSILSAEPDLIAAVVAGMQETFGPVDCTSPLLPFGHTRYYQKEMGADLVRQIISFRRLIDPGRLAEIKNQTNRLEQEWAVEGSRQVNIDPGYLTLAKLVLASTKDHAHRIYLGAGIYAEVTLRFRNGAYHPWEWTYPDYAQAEYHDLFGEIRDLLVLQLRRRDAVDAE